MKKMLLLARILRKTGNAKDTTDRNSVTGDVTPILYTFGVIILAVLFFFAGKFLAGLSGLLPTDGIFQMLFLIAGSVVFFLTLVDLVNGLYMSSDNPVLFALPLTPAEIIGARFYNTVLTKILLASALLLPCGIGYGIFSGTSDVGFFAGLFFGDITVPLIAAFSAGILIILIMSIFHFIRNRDVITVIGVILALAASFIYIIAVNSDTEINAEVATQAVTDLMGFTTRTRYLIPVVPFLSKIMAGGSLVNFLPVILITAAYAALFFLVAMTLYLNSALRMQDTSAKGKTLNSADIKKAGKQRSVRKGYRRKELISVFRNPVYITNGWLMPLVWPILIAIPFLFSKNSFGDLSGLFISGSITELFETPAMEAAFFRFIIVISVLASSSAAGFSSLSTNVLNREGKSFYIMKTLPVSYGKQIRAKRDAGLLISFIGSTGYLLIGTLIVLFLGQPFRIVLWCLYGTLLSAPLLLLLCNVFVIRGLNKPNLNWESEATIAKNNSFGIIIWFVAFLGSIILAFVIPTTITEFFHTPWIPALILLILISALAVLSEKLMMKTADRVLEAL